MMSLVSFGFAILALLFSDVDIKHGNDKDKQYTLCVAKENGGEVCTYTVTVREKLPLGDSNSKNLPKDAGYAKIRLYKKKRSSAHNFGASKKVCLSFAIIDKPNNRHRRMN